MWRGSSTGGAFTVLSHSFEDGGDGICTGGEINLVRSLAAGGAAVDRFSNVIYAGTDGFGPLIPTTPPGGHIWVNTNVAGVPSVWTDQTGSINPNNFPISSVAIDTFDSSGATAYVGIMGFSSPQFPSSHVWKTTDGGTSWIDFTGNLPNAPVNSIVVDPFSTNTPGVVYVGTDVGVFSTPTASSPPPNWTEVGTPGGCLPNVAVTALAIFTQQDSAQLLRASTYGRGVWEFPLGPDYFLTISNSPITVFAGQAVPAFNGAIDFLDGYTCQVNLSCTPSSTCSVTPLSAQPPPVEQALSANVIASNIPGDYVFDLHGSGEDSSHLQNDAFFTLKVVDFNLTAPSPASITVPPATVSGPVSFQVTGQGAFDDTVDLSCSNLPSGATCNFLPSGSVNPTAGNPVAVTLTVTTVSSATAGTFPITISGSVTNGPTKTQSLSLTITLDYSLVISNPSLQAYVNSTVNFNGVLTSLNGYNSGVNLSCGTGAPPTCTAAPALVAPTASGAPFIVTVGSPACGSYNFNIVAAGTDAQKTSHLFPVAFTANSYTTPNYTLDVTPGSQTVGVNVAAIFNGTLQGTDCYNSAVNLSCGSNHPPSCSVSPSSPVPTVSPAPPAPFTVTVSSAVDQTYNFDVVGVGTDPLSRQQQVLVSFTSTGGSGTRPFSFTITPSSSIQSLPAGQPAIYTLNVVPAGGAFPNNASLAYSANCPPLSTCTVSPTQVNKGISGETQVTFTITTTAPVIAGVHPARGFRPLIYSLWLSLPGLVVVWRGMRRSRRKRCVLFLLLPLIVVGLWLEIACSGGLQGNGSGSGQAGTPSGTYTMTVSATVSSLPQQTAQVQLTVN